MAQYFDWVPELCTNFKLWATSFCTWLLNVILHLQIARCQGQMFHLWPTSETSTKPSGPHGLTGSLVPTWTPWIPLDVGWLTKVFPERCHDDSIKCSRTCSGTLSFINGMEKAGILECSGAPLLWSIASVSSSAEALSTTVQWSTPVLLCGEAPVIAETPVRRGPHCSGDLYRCYG